MGEMILRLWGLRIRHRPPCALPGRDAGGPRTKVFDLLAYLIQHHDQFVSRDKLYAQLWSQQFVSEAALTYCIAEARKAVGDNGRAQRVIKTVHGRGYRFIAPVASACLAALLGRLRRPFPYPKQTQRLLPLQGRVSLRFPSSMSIPQKAPGRCRQLSGLSGAINGTVVSGASSVHSRPLDPEEIHQVIQDVQRVCDQIIQRFDGWMAQHFGDGFVVYFGYPRAHEDNARRAAHTALEIVEEHGAAVAGVQETARVEFTVQVGIHTGIAVFSAFGSGDRRVQPALGDTPHIAAQLASLAAPNMVVVSPATLQLIEGYFVCRVLGVHIPDNAESLVMYQVCQESEAQSRSTWHLRLDLRRLWEGARGRAVARALGPGQGRERTGCGAGAGGGDWQIPPSRCCKNT